MFKRAGRLRGGMASIREKLEEESKKADKQKAGEYPDKWMPTAAGDKLVGKITEIENGRDEEHAHLTFITIVDEDGKEWSVLQTTVMASRMRKLNKKVGDEIGLEYRGEQPSKKRKGKSYKVFVVV
jgi:hypothetical protein